MNDQEMREWVSDLYKGHRWKARVRLMPEAQIYMIYHSKQVIDEGQAEEGQEPEQLQLDI